MELILDKIQGNFKVTGVDASESDIGEAKKRGIYEALFLADVRKLSFSDKAFDVVVLFEVLEHLPKDAGSELLARVEAIARKGVIITTPAYLDRVRRGTETEDVAFYTTLYKNEPHKMPHVAMWKGEEYHRLGYNVKATGVHIAKLPYFINLVLTALFTPFVYFFSLPVASSLVAVKNVSTNENE